MDVQKYTLAMPALKNMPENERTCFLMAGHLANEILFLGKLLIITQYRPEIKVTQKAELTQALFVIRMISGKLFEGWEAIRRFYHGTQLSREYNERIRPDAQDSLRSLGRYFGNGENLIAKVRNNYAFHYSPDRLINAVDDLSDGEENEMYIAETHLNSLYYISDVLVVRSMVRDFELETIENSLEVLYDQVLEVQGHMLNFINGFMGAAAGRHFVKDEFNPIPVDVGDLPDLREIRMPFFVDLQR